MRRSRTVPRQHDRRYHSSSFCCRCKNVARTAVVQPFAGLRLVYGHCCGGFSILLWLEKLGVSSFIPFPCPHEITVNNASIRKGASKLYHRPYLRWELKNAQGASRYSNVRLQILLRSRLRYCSTIPSIFTVTTELEQLERVALHLNDITNVRRFVWWCNQDITIIFRMKMENVKQHERIESLGPHGTRRSLARVTTSR